VLIDESWAPSGPRWAPDGLTIGFVSAHAAADAPTTGARAPAPRAQLWTVASAGGTPRRVTSIGNGVSNCVWSDDGKRAACLVRTGPSDAWPAGKERSDVRHYTQSSYKFNDTGWFDDRRSHIWVVDVFHGVQGHRPILDTQSLRPVSGLTPDDALTSNRTRAANKGLL